MEFDKPRLGPTLGRAAHLAKANMGARVAQFDITPAQTHVLLYLHHHGGQAPQYELTSFLQVKPSTANGVLNRMEEKGDNHGSGHFPGASGPSAGDFGPYYQKS